MLAVLVAMLFTVEAEGPERLGRLLRGGILVKNRGSLRTEVFYRVFTYMMTIDVLPYVLCHLNPDCIPHPFHNKFLAYIQRNLDLTNKVTARY